MLGDALGEALGDAVGAVGDAVGDALGASGIMRMFVVPARLPTVLVSGSMYSASYGQAFMHDLHPMQLSSWKSTTPFSAR